MTGADSKAVQSTGKKKGVNLRLKNREARRQVY